jgi:ABC-type bacteriocin/lantibiotic exporter with double-glycine peptidase domain
MTASQNNIFVNLLKELGVKHTRSFSGRYFNEHPHKYSMYGLSKMLSDYLVENAGFRIKDREEMLSELEAPFVAHAGGDFVIVSSIRNGQVTYIWKNKRIVVPADEFVKSWSGIVLLAEPIC